MPTRTCLRSLLRSALSKRQLTSSATGPQPSHSRSLFANVAAHYERALSSQPVATKAITSGVLYGAGDWLAQTIVTRRAAADGEANVRFDAARWCRAVLFGGVFYPGIAHVHYNFLEHLVVVRWAVPTSRVPFVKMFIEQFVYWSYFSNAYYHTVLGALQGYTMQQCFNRVRDTLWETLKAQWAFWIPAQLINFKYVPVRHQLNFVLVVSLAWTTFLSLAFPPDTGIADKKSAEPEAA